MRKLSVVAFFILIIFTLCIQVLYTSCNKNSCENFVCWNGGSCVDGTCECKGPWKGEICTTPDAAHDLCLDIDCLNGATCDSGVCICAAGYEGTTCTTISRVKFVKNWSAADNCSSSGSSNYTASISNGTNIYAVIIGNFRNQFPSVNAIVNEKDITIPLQVITIGANEYQITGNGLFNSNKIFWSYTIINNTTSVTDACTSTWQ